MENVETIKYKGFDIEICQDDNYDGPGDWGDDNLFLVNYHNDFFVENDKVITKDEAEEWYNGEKIEQAKKYHIFALSMLSHSGVWLSLENSFRSDSGGWDTSHIGIVLVSKEEAKTKAKAKKLAEGLIQTWNDYLSGNVYGFSIDKLNESCWGFYGDYLTSGIIDEAKGVIDYEIEQRTKKHTKKLKAYINNKVSLENRKPLKATMFS